MERRNASIFIFVFKKQPCTCDALPDNPAVFVCGMPRLLAEVAAALITDNAAGKAPPMPAVLLWEGGSHSRYH